MITKRLIDKLIWEADIENLKVFAQVAIEHLVKRYPYSDDAVINALEIISGIANPYEEKDFDKTKILESTRKMVYKGEDIEEVKIKHIDNFNLEVSVGYKINSDDKYESYLCIPIREVAIDEDLKS